MYEIVMTEEEYLRQLKAACLTECGICKERYPIGHGVTCEINLKTYCSARCVAEAAIRYAPMAHRRATNAVTINGWDV